MLKSTIVPVVSAGIWISVYEFFRNEVLIKGLWVEHYASLGLVFPGEPINGLVWGLWSMVFAACIHVMLKRFSFWEMLALAWTVGFLMMWLVTGNMAVLPFVILPIAVPLSLLEVAIAIGILRRFAPKESYK